MAQHQPPHSQEAWRQQTNELLLQLHADVQRLWKRIDQYPQHWVGEYPGTFTTISTSTTTIP